MSAVRTLGFEPSSADARRGLGWAGAGVLFHHLLSTSAHFTHGLRGPSHGAHARGLCLRFRGASRSRTDGAVRGAGSRIHTDNPVTKPGGEGVGSARGQFTSRLAREGLRTEPLQHETGLRVRRWVRLWPQSYSFLHPGPPRPPGPAKRDLCSVQSVAQTQG